MTTRRTTTARGYGAAWQKLRIAVFAAYGTSCWMCGRPADTVDHLDPIAHYGTELPTVDRCRPACRSCNAARSNRARAKRSRLQW